MSWEKLERIKVPLLDEILGKSFPVLNEGFVRVIDYMGNDSSVVQGARVSYGKGTKSVNDDRSLIRYLFRNEHTSPFEFPNIRFHIKLPIFVIRQLIRHRTASVNEVSLRYSEANDEFFSVYPDQWRVQSKTNKQGSCEEIIEICKGSLHTKNQIDLHKLLFDKYQERLNDGISKELSRIDLPLSLYTEIYWQMDLKNLLHFLKLRMDKHAQKEIREYANVIGHEVVKKWCPLTWEAFEEYTLESIKFGKTEISILKKIFSNLKNNIIDLKDIPLKGSEEKEFLEKLEKLDILQQGC